MHRQHTDQDRPFSSRSERAHTGLLLPACFLITTMLGAGLAEAQDFRGERPKGDRVSTNHVSGAALAESREDVAQELAAARTPGVAEVPSRCFGLAEGNGLWGIGPDYKALFRAGGMEFTPALGSAVHESQQLILEFRSLSRGEFELGAKAEVAPRRSDPVVVYDHGFVVERYEVREDGVELSFLVESRPEGEGPLVARLDLECSLPYQGQRADGSLDFGLADVGGVHIGTVTGIDARGRRVAGSARFDGKELELSLPADFVDEAEYPVLLDPVVGSTFNTATPLATDRSDPDIAYDVSNDCYLVAWDRQYSDIDSEIYGAVIGSTGAILVPTILIANDPDSTQINPSVGNCNVNDRFLCAFQQKTIGNTTWDIGVKGVLASDGSINLSSAPIISTGSTNQLDPDVGGEMTLDDNDVIVVWSSEGEGIRARQVTVPAAPTLCYTIGDVIELSTSTTDSKPAISKSAGTDGNLLVVWQRLFPGSPGDHDLRGRVISRNGIIVAPTGVSPAILISTIGPDEEDPDCDGADGRWLVAYETEAVMDGGDNDIHCLNVELAGANLLLENVGTVVEGDVNDDEQDPAVGYTGESHIVVWKDQAGSYHDLGVRALHPDACLPCEEEEVINGGFDDLGVEIATVFSGGGSGRGAMFAWESQVLLSGHGEILASLQLDRLARADGDDR